MSDNQPDTRRAFLVLAGTGAMLSACRQETRAYPEPAPQTVKGPAPRPAASAKPEEGETEELSATEDLMREHGVIRRILVVYRLSAVRLRTKPNSLQLDALQRAAKLMRTFGEEYHERQLEEAHLFPALTAAGGNAAAEIPTLLAQHQRGREITEYLLALTQKTIGNAADPAARTLEAFALMYEEHAAREDTIVFPAWKKALPKKQLDEMGELFEDIEHKTFGKDGFDDAVEQIAAIERTLAFDPASLTAPPPPKIG
ncbi:MAG TPA: hemerythrin domain-containing protein [Polyangiaceae bacterium]|nr:hemerythrin domain-containing protein [Polyangiaceae bacterium]